MLRCSRLLEGLHLNREPKYCDQRAKHWREHLDPISRARIAPPWPFQPQLQRRHLMDLLSFLRQQYVRIQDDPVLENSRFGKLLNLPSQDRNH